MLHIRYKDQSYDFSEVQVPKGASDEEVRSLAAGQLDVDINELNGYQVSLNDAGETIVYPEPVYG